MATTTLNEEMLLRIRQKMDRAFFFDGFTSTVASEPPKAITKDTIREWTSAVQRRAGEVMASHVPHTFIIRTAQEQRRTPVIGHFYARAEKRRTKPKRHRKCSRRMWQRMNRKQFDRIPIYAEPTDVLMFDGKAVVTPQQKQALQQATIIHNSTG